MKNYIFIRSLLLAGSVLGLSACEEQASKEKELEKKVAELQEALEKEKLSETSEKKEQEPKEKPETSEVKVIHPLSQRVIKTFDPGILGFGTKDEAYKKEIKDWARAAAKGSEKSIGLDQRMLPDKIGPNGEIIKGKPRIIFEEEEFLEQVLALSRSGGDLELPLTITESGYKPEEAAHLGEAVAASYTTRFDKSLAGRTRNIELSAQAIHNVILGTGDIFSFNTTVGPSDAAHGYQKAKEALNGKLVDGIGGGICQTSSTLYNAIDQLGVSYVEKHHHSLNVGYVPNGRDATVSYGGLDFRFQNTAGVPFLIKTIVDKQNGTLTVEVRTSEKYMARIRGQN
ncbi:vancomycin resistance protein YoaR [Peribacillus deserti]|uniref:Vancomycin resistance protein YoaR n=1 Tax=Peribacillus deserti TaxID=673318 RepID=A0ABS2QFT3_9BACI|nr:VanW family protein [Peribacillus deserti]MBM7692016.1 vancomycin resistance protein YoaR [Peribacillus deserti]